MSEFTLTQGVEGNCLVLDDVRIAGPKPWGGGRVIATFTTEERYIPERMCHPVIEDETEVCSECGYDIDWYGWFYCPSCGSKLASE